jgi:hypothetical protein
MFGYSGHECLVVCSLSVPWYIVYYMEHRKELKMGICTFIYDSTFELIQVPNIWNAQMLVNFVKWSYHILSAVEVNWTHSIILYIVTVWCWMWSKVFLFAFLKLESTQNKYKRYKNARNFLDEKAKCQPWLIKEKANFRWRSQNWMKIELK